MPSDEVRMGIVLISLLGSVRNELTLRYSPIRSKVYYSFYLFFTI